jgi:hypothetical protein
VTRMGSDDGGTRTLRSHTEALTGAVGGKVSSSSDCEKWKSLANFVEILGARDVELVRMSVTDVFITEIEL